MKLIKPNGDLHEMKLKAGQLLPRERATDELHSMTALQTSKNRFNRYSSSRYNLTSMKSYMDTSKYSDPSNNVNDEMRFESKEAGPIKTKATSKRAAKNGRPRGGVLVPFPEKLHRMLSKAEREMFDHIISWQPHGRSFMVHQPKRFVAEIMPRFFKQSKLTSFQRQLNLYGFSRLTSGPDRGGYYHELFLRGQLQQSKRMIRTRVKGTGAKIFPSPFCEPNFYAMEACLEVEENEEEEVEVEKDDSSPIDREVIVTDPCPSMPCVVSFSSSDAGMMSLKKPPTIILTQKGESTGDLSLEQASETAEECAKVVPKSPQSVACTLDGTLTNFGGSHHPQGSRCMSPLAQLLASHFNDVGDDDDLADEGLFQNSDEISFEGHRFHFLDTDLTLEGGHEGSGVAISPGKAFAPRDYTAAEWKKDDMWGQFYFAP